MIDVAWDTLDLVLDRLRATATRLEELDAEDPDPVAASVPVLLELGAYLAREDAWAAAQRDSAWDTEAHDDRRPPRTPLDARLARIVGLIEALPGALPDGDREGMGEAAAIVRDATAAIAAALTWPTSPADASARNDRTTGPPG
jgi:hypothetical protein